LTAPLRSALYRAQTGMRAMPQSITTHVHALVADAEREIETGGMKGRGE